MGTLYATAAVRHDSGRGTHHGSLERVREWRQLQERTDAVVSAELADGFAIRVQGWQPAEIAGQAVCTTTLAQSAHCVGALQLHNNACTVSALHGCPTVTRSPKLQAGLRSKAQMPRAWML